MKKITALLCMGIAMQTIGYAQQQMDIIQYNISNTPVFGTNNIFKAIGIGKGGHVWAGTPNQGLFKFDGQIWEKSLSLTNHNIADIKTDKNGAIWVGQYGSNGAQSTGGGINYFSDNSFSPMTYYGTPAGLPSKNVRSIFINNALSYSTIYPYHRIWAAVYAQTNVSQAGAVARGNNDAFPNFYKITSGVDINTSLGTGGCFTIGGSKTEGWAFASNNYGHSQLLKYNLKNYTFQGYIDDSNSPLPAGFNAKAIYFDKEGRTWVGMGSDGIFIYANGSWTHFNNTSIFPAGSFVNNNAITGDQEGNVYIGTSSGLVVFNGGPTNDLASYTLFTTTNGLPSNSVQAIAIDTFNKDPYFVKLATSGGVVFWKPYTIETYNIKTNTPSARTYLNTQEVMISSDSSVSTLFKVILSGANNCRFRILENPDNNAPFSGEYGKLYPYKRTTDSIIYLYRHPSKPMTAGFSRTIHLEVFDSITQSVKASAEVQIVRPPLLLLHGFNSSGDAAFGNMKNMLVNSGLYKEYQIMTGNYPSRDGFSQNLPRVIIEKEKLKFECVTKAKISAGKIDVAGHSMGGLLSRLYLQSSNYKNDINKLITFNSPHSGSPLGNLANSLDILLILFSSLSMDDISPALLDLRLGGPGVTQQLNGPSLNARKVPTHAIVSVIGPPAVPNTLSSLDIDELILFLAIHKANQSAGTFLDYLYGGDQYDRAVGLISQKGGLASPYFTLIDNQDHSTTAAPNMQAYNFFVELLNRDPDDPTVFTKNGYAPATIPVPVGLLKQAQIAGTLDITSPVTGGSFGSNSNLVINFQTSNIDTIILVLGGLGKPLYVDKFVAASTHQFTIPNEYSGITQLFALGFNSTGFTAMDSIYFNVTNTFTSDSLWIIPQKMIVAKNHFETFSLYSKFSDGITRTITGAADAIYSFSSNKVSFTYPNKIVGNVLGEDTLTVTYAGQTATLPIEIIDESNWLSSDPVVTLPVKMGNLSGKMDIGKAQLKWITYDDIDAKMYEIQHSENGNDFNFAGLVKPLNQAITTTYKFDHFHYAPGNNFYRIKVLEHNGSIFFSNVIQLVSSKATILGLKPNPVINNLQFYFNSHMQSKASCRIIGADGKLVQQFEINLNQGNNKIDTDIKNLPAGYYILQIDTGSEVQKATFIKR